MECDKLRKEFPDFEFEPCCISCHEDDDTGHGFDLWFEDPDHRDRNVCCAIYRGLEEIKLEKKHD